MVTGFLFSMFSASFWDKALFRPFVFKMFSASFFSARSGHIVALQAVTSKARKTGCHQSLLAPRQGDEAKDRARISAGVPACRTTAQPDRHQAYDFSLFSCRCQAKLLTVVPSVPGRSANSLGFRCEIRVPLLGGAPKTGVGFHFRRTSGEAPQLSGCDYERHEEVHGYYGSGACHFCDPPRSGALG